MRHSIAVSPVGSRCVDDERQHNVWSRKKLSHHPCVRGPRCKIPIADNCIKFVLDALQPKVVADDKIVTKVIAEKKWCDTATAEHTTIELLVRV